MRSRARAFVLVAAIFACGKPPARSSEPAEDLGMCPCSHSEDDPLTELARLAPSEPLPQLSPSPSDADFAGFRATCRRTQARALADLERVRDHATRDHDVVVAVMLRSQIERMAALGVTLTEQQDDLHTRVVCQQVYAAIAEARQSIAVDCACVAWGKSVPGARAWLSLETRHEITSAALVATVVQVDGAKVIDEKADACSDRPAPDASANGIIAQGNHALDVEMRIAAPCSPASAWVYRRELVVRAHRDLSMTRAARLRLVLKDVRTGPTDPIDERSFRVEIESVE